MSRHERTGSSEVEEGGEPEKQLREIIETELKAAGWSFKRGDIIPPKLSSKEELRRLHQAQRQERAEQQKAIVEKHGAAIIREFAEGHEVNPRKFAPELVSVDSAKWEAKVFRFATLLWSVPVSQGYGRRMRYLVRDQSNGKWVGLVALGDPVFNLAVRDNDIGWTAEDRRNRLYNVMDAYVLGAVPPYNRLLGGKYIALATGSNEVREDFSEKYEGKTTIIQGRRKPASLVLITTTSALGRSSIYNRLKLPDEDMLMYRSVGYSKGWGHFHFSNQTFELMRAWLKQHDEPYADGHNYGDGPNWRLRTIRRALNLLGYDGELLRHGIQREVFMIPLAKNYREYLRGDDESATYYERGLANITEFFKERWMIPRSRRMSDWREWTRQDTWGLILENTNWSFSLTYL